MSQASSVKLRALQPLRAAFSVTGVDNAHTFRIV